MSSDESYVTTYRQVPVGTEQPDAVTVGIEHDSAGRYRAAVWWEAHDDVDADEAEYDDVFEAFAAAEAARQLHGFKEVVVALQKGLAWQPTWGVLQGNAITRESIGDVSAVDISSEETYELAAGIEAERDA